MGKPMVYFLFVVIFLYITGMEVAANNGGRGGQQQQPPGPDSPFWAARGRRSDKELNPNSFDDIISPGILQDTELHSKSETPTWLSSTARGGDSNQDETVLGRRPQWPGLGFNYISPQKLDDLARYMWNSWRKRSGGPPDTPMDPFWAARG